MRRNLPLLACLCWSLTSAAIATAVVPAACKGGSEPCPDLIALMQAPATNPIGPLHHEAVRSWLTADRAAALPYLRQLAVSNESQTSLFGRLSLVEAGELTLTQPNFKDVWAVGGQPYIALFEMLQWMRSDSAVATLKSTLVALEPDIEGACQYSKVLNDSERRRLAPWLLPWAQRALDAIPKPQQPLLEDVLAEPPPPRLAHAICVSNTLTAMAGDIPEAEKLEFWLRTHRNMAYRYIAMKRRLRRGQIEPASSWPEVLLAMDDVRLQQLGAEIASEVAAQRANQIVEVVPQAALIELCAKEIDRRAGIEWRATSPDPQVLRRIDHPDPKQVELKLGLGSPTAIPSRLQNVICVLSLEPEVQVTRLDLEW